MQFEFATATRIIFGEGAIQQLPAAVLQVGIRALVVTGSDSERHSSVLANLEAEGVVLSEFPVTGEPTIDTARMGAAAAREAGCDVVIGIGGGSALDAGKAIAALAVNDGDPLDYLEVVGRGRPMEEAPLPYVAVPTTAGTGTEVTRNAVLGCPEEGVKASLRSPLMLPRLALVDPQLTYGLPRAITASTGLDALTQLIEPYVSIRANPLTDTFCGEGIRRVARSLVRAWENGSDAAARADMSFASLLGGLCLANAGLGAAHGFAAPIGGMFAAPHGAVCALLLPHVMRANIDAAKARGDGNPGVRERYRHVAQWLTGQEEATVEHGIEWVEQVCAKLAIPALGEYGVQSRHVPSLVSKAAQASSMKANPIVLTADELTRILSAAL